MEQQNPEEKVENKDNQEKKKSIPIMGEVKENINIRNNAYNDIIINNSINKKNEKSKSKSIVRAIIKVIIKVM